MLYIPFILAYLTVGLFMMRRAYAVEKYEASQLTSCKSDCNSYAWISHDLKRKYCSCGYLKLGEGVYYAGVFLWPLVFVFDTTHNIITGGTYEPKEVKAQRKVKELEETIKQLEKENEIGASKDVHLR